MFTSSNVVGAQRLGRLYGNSWKRISPAPLNLVRPFAVTLQDGRIVIGTGDSPWGTRVTNVLIGTVSLDGNISWVSTNAFPQAMGAVRATTLSDNRILCVSGYNGTYTTVSYLGTVSGNSISWVQTTPFPTNPGSFDQNFAGRILHTIQTLPDGRVFACGGYIQNATWNGSNYVYTESFASTAYLGTISANTVSWVQTTNLPEGLGYHSCLVLTDGRLLLMGGQTGSASRVGSYPGLIGTNRPNVYIGTVSGNTVTWTQTTNLPMNQPPKDSTTSWTPWAALFSKAIVLPNNQICILTSSSQGDSRMFIGSINSNNTITWVPVEGGIEFRNSVINNNESQILFSRWPHCTQTSHIMYSPICRRIIVIRPGRDVPTPDRIQFSNTNLITYPDGERTDFIEVPTNAQELAINNSIIISNRI